jgi:hypothetical protein
LNVAIITCMANEPGELLPTNEKFSGIISDQDRREVLAGPTPMIIEALANTVNKLRPGEKFKIKARVLYLGGKNLSPIIQNFFMVAEGQKPASGLPFHNGKDFEYLPIICGVIEGTREMDKVVVNRVTEELKTNTQRLSSHPERDNALKAVDTIIKNFTRPART